ncbi:isoprenylcysteine carboxylmethyltransferase family protein [Chitinophaga sp. HK235]|uniref:methyltransferase family protein n=1 Tax=Chitinophaga sp. HK235 TaxID=2952571 RepID=UPI001BA4DCE1|nr:isoprenylcysteine carboxylmethyltransferase family protein [Chitinophaga sp. HK235]
MSVNSTVFIYITLSSWALFCICWLLLRNRNKENIQTRTSRQRFMGALGYLVIFTALYMSLFIQGHRLLPTNLYIQAIGAILCMVGVATAIWSRVLLGTNWSGGVTAKKDHELIVRGPYRLIRHPIYTGFVAAMAGTCLVTGGWSAIIVSTIYTLGLCMKINREETLLNELFPGTYAVYQQHTRKLIPFIW